MAVENNGGLDTALHVSQLDGAADRIGRASPLVDDFVSVLYPPMLHTVVLQKVGQFHLHLIKRMCL